MEHTKCLASQYIRRTVKLLKYSMQVSLDSCRIFSMAIFPDNDKLNKAQKKDQDCVSHTCLS